MSAAVLGAVIVLAGMLVLVQLRSGDEPVAATRPSVVVRPSTTPPPSTTPSTTLPPSMAPQATPPATGEAPPVPPAIEPVQCPAAVDPVICDAAVFVQERRRRPFVTFPTVEVLDDVAFDEARLADFEQYRAELEFDEVLLVALGLLDAEASLVDAYRSSLGIGLIGFYDPDRPGLVVRGGELDLHAQRVLVGELTRALDDQWFDVGRDAVAGVAGDAGYGIAAVAEGNASRLARLWVSALEPGERDELRRQELGALSPRELQTYLSLPPVLQQLQASPGVDGARYVDHLVGQGGEAAVDEALTKPPSTSEEVLHPGLDRASDVEIDVRPPPADGAVVGEGRLGELLVKLWLGPRAAGGWGGDRYVTWIEDGRSCVAADLVGDDDVETAEMLEAARRWVTAADARSVEPLTLDGRDAVRVTGCG